MPLGRCALNILTCALTRRREDPGRPPEDAASGHCVGRDWDGSSKLRKPTTWHPQELDEACRFQGMWPSHTLTLHF